MTDRTFEPASAPEYVTANPADRRAPELDHLVQSPQAQPGSRHRAPVAASASHAAELAQISIGVVGLMIAIGAAWMTFGSSSSWVNQRPDKQPLQSTPALAQLGSGCGSAVVSPASGRSDGRFPLQADIRGFAPADIESFMVLGKEAAQVGRQRDAEAAFLMSCRIAEQLKGAESVETARAKHELGLHYAQLATASNGVSEEGIRQEMIRRAANLYAESLRLNAVPVSRPGQAPQVVAGSAASPWPAAGSQNSEARAELSTQMPASDVREEQPLQPSSTVPEAPQPSAQPLPAATPPRNTVRSSVARRGERKPSAGQKVWNASAASTIAELYRGH